MLAVVLILTVIPMNVQVGRAAIEHTCFLVSQKLLENDEVCNAILFVLYHTLNISGFFDCRPMC